MKQAAQPSEKRFQLQMRQLEDLVSDLHRQNTEILDLTVTIQRFGEVAQDAIRQGELQFAINTIEAQRDLIIKTRHLEGQDCKTCLSLLDTLRLTGDTVRRYFGWREPSAQAGQAAQDGAKKGNARAARSPEPGRLQVA